MQNKKISSIALMIATIMLLGAIIPITQATDMERLPSFNKGPSELPVTPMKKIALVQYDNEKIIDDYAYLAAIPTTVFEHDGKLFSYPLLFYEDEYRYEDDKERVLNAYQGLDYFMEDWMEYSNGELDQKILINMDENDASKWDAKETVIIKDDDPYEIAKQIALQDWSYSDDAVIAVIETEYEKPKTITESEVSSTLNPIDVIHRTYKIERPVVGTGATYKTFDIEDENYKYIVGRMTWAERIDFDLQLYDDQLGMVQAAANSYGGDFPYQETVGSYIHNYGKWEISVSAVPKKGISESESPGFMESMFYKPTSTPTAILSKPNTLDVEFALLPGTMVDLISSPFGCRDVDITLKWDDPGVDLGFTVLDPIGTEIDSTISIEDEVDKCFVETGHTTNNNGNDKTEISLKIDRFGECREGEHYSICVFALEDINIAVDFTIEYSWKQNFSKIEGDLLASATNGAVLASALNAPLLYVSPSELPKVTENVLYKLGVEKIHLVNLGGHLKKDVQDEIKNIAEIKNNYEKPLDIYDGIRDITGKNDVIFTTIDPWDYWYVNERVSAGTYPGALHIGPAAYIAAHHCSPVIIVDIHPRLSQAIVYSTDWWNKNAIGRFVEPSSGSMVLTSFRAYDFLEEYGFGKIEDTKEKAAGQDQETMITVAGQFEIGTPWDRCFTGAALPGRFWASPVDSAYAISRNIFYPALIFMNPGTEKIELINGSKSEIQKIGGRLKDPIGVNLVITRKSGLEEFEYPMLMTFNTYGYRFNEKASEHWDFKYERADGIIPWDTHSEDPIDDGAANGKTGAYYPDMSESEVCPFYARKGGYDAVFSTSFEPVVENLNDGVLTWLINCHGMFTNGGMISLWDPDNPYIYEENPWRAYEPILLHPGNIREFVRWIVYTLTGEQPTSFTDGLIKWHFLTEVGCTENPDVAHINPELINLNKLRKAFSLPIDFWGAWGIMIYQERLKNPLETIREGLPFIRLYEGDGKVTISPISGHQTMTWYVGVEWDDALENLHSCGINTISCLPANTYLHLTWMRHGTSYQIIDPWTTTDWAGAWQQLVLKRVAMGDTIGQAYERGMRACGPEFPVGQWWWDVWENVCFFGDPDLRVFVPSTEYSDNNYWTEEEVQPIKYDEELNLAGHMPYGATSYPHEKEPDAEIPLWAIILIAVILVLIVVAGAVRSDKKNKKK